MGNKEEKNNTVPNGSTEITGRRHKSARPGRISYVPISDEDLAPYEPPVRKKHKGLKITGIAVAMVIVSAGAAYAGMSYYYSDKFFEGTSINGIDCSGKTAYEAEQKIAKTVENYSIEVDSRNLDPQTISGDQIGYSYVSDGSVLKLLKGQKPYEWIRGFFEKKSYTAAENTTYDKEKLKKQVKALNCAQEENQVAPENAYVAYGDSQFEIVPETAGSKLDLKNAYNVLSEAVSGNKTSVDFDSEPDVYVKADITSDNPDLQASLNACNNFTKANITYTFGDETETLDGNTIKDWLNFDEKGQLIMDDTSFRQHIADYVAQLAAAHDTVGTEREFQTTSGRTVSVYGSAYGWQIDQASEVAQLTQEIQSGTQTTREPVYSMTANAHGYNDIGNTYIEVDLSEQHMYFYQNGEDIFESDIVSGDMRYSDRQTPAGIYTLYYKKSPDVLRGKQLTQEIQSGTQTTREPVYSMTANAHGYNDIGNTYIEVDLSEQHMYFYQNGEDIFESDIVSGDMRYSDRQTPAGIYTLYYKKSPDVLRGKQLANGKYEYEQPVTYWMPFNGGIGFHDANWQPYFGGDRFMEGGSHGCINMPPEKAAELYNIIECNIPIVCFY